MAQQAEKLEMKTMREDIETLKHTVRILQDRLLNTEENLKLNLYEERGLKTDIRLMENRMSTIISHRIDTEAKKITEKCEQKFEKAAKEQAGLKAEIDKNFAIQQNQELGLEKKEIEKYIKEQIAQECTEGMRAFRQTVTDMIKSFAEAQEVQLEKRITDELVGRFAVRELEQEVKVREELHAASKAFQREFGAKMEAKLEEDTSANKAAFLTWSSERLRDDLGALREAFQADFTKFLNRESGIHKRELQDVMEEEVNDKLDECTRRLETFIKDELAVKIALQKQVLLQRVLDEIVQRSEKHKAEVLTHVLLQLNKTLANQKLELERNFTKYVDNKMRATELEFCDHFSAQINENIEAESQELRKSLSDEFNNEILLMHGFLQDQHETGLNLRKDIEALDSQYFAKTDFLLAKYSTEHTWPVGEFLRKFEMFQSGLIAELHGEAFVVARCGRRMQAKLSWRNNNLILSLGFVHPDPSTQQAPIYFHRRVVMLLDQCEHESLRKHRLRLEDPCFGQEMAEKWMTGCHPFGVQLFPPVGDLAKSSFLKGGTLLIQIRVEPLDLLYKSFASNDGTLLWKIENVSTLIAEEKNGTIDRLSSEYFYSSPNGYRMQVSAYFRSVYVSLHLNFLRGEHDQFLPARFPHRTTFVILDQMAGPQKKHLTETVETEDTYVDAVERFALRAEVLGKSVPLPKAYVVGDALLIKVIVEPKEDLGH